MANIKENRAFADELFSQHLLDEAIDWITTNMAVDDVFPEECLAQWAEEHGYVKEEEE